MHPEKYLFDKALERLNADVEHHPRSKININKNDTNTNETTFCSYMDASDLSPVLYINRFSAQKTSCLETSENDDAQPSEEPFEALTEAMEKMPANKRRKNDENEAMIRLLDQLYLESKNRSKKNIIAMHIKDVQASMSEYVWSAGVGRLLLQLARMTRPRGRRGRKDQNKK